MVKLCESTVEEMTIEELQSLGFIYISGVDLAPETLNPERNSFGDVLLMRRLQDEMTRLNPTIPADAVQSATRKLSRVATSNLLADNEEFQKILVDGVPVVYRKGGDIKGDYVHVLDFVNPLNNEFLVVNQYIVVQNNNNKRPEVLLFVNGIPLAIFELKNPAMRMLTVTRHMTSYRHITWQFIGFSPITKSALSTTGWRQRRGH